MNLPLALSPGYTESAELVAALLTGVGFGFALERAGFGTARNLVSVFYGRDFRVLRVMFTAIVTAMLGVYLLDLVGVMPVAQLGLMPTFVLPQLVGGLLVGAGFIIGGYCPGTSLVAMVSGKLDAVVFLVGLLVGSLAFEVAYPALASFHNGTAMGRVLLHEYLGVGSGVAVFGVVLFALGAFWIVGRVERWVNGGAS